MEAQAVVQHVDRGVRRLGERGRQPFAPFFEGASNPALPQGEERPDEAPVGGEPSVLQRRGQLAARLLDLAVGADVVVVPGEEHAEPHLQRRITRLPQEMADTRPPGLELRVLGRAHEEHVPDRQHDQGAELAILERVDVGGECEQPVAQRERIVEIARAQEERGDPVAESAQLWLPRAGGAKAALRALELGAPARGVDEQQRAPEPIRELCAALGLGHREAPAHERLDAHRLEERPRQRENRRLRVRQVAALEPQLDRRLPVADLVQSRRTARALRARPVPAEDALRALAQEEGEERVQRVRASLAVHEHEQERDASSRSSASSSSPPERARATGGSMCGSHATSIKASAAARGSAGTPRG